MEAELEFDWRSKKMTTDQNPNSSSLDVVKKIEIQSAPGQLNPLQMNYLVAEILNFLDISSLKQCRLVCSIWAVEGGKHLLYKSNLKSGFRHGMKVSQKQKYAGSLSQFLSLTGTSKSLKIAVGPSENLRLLEREFKSGIYERVKMLSFNKTGNSALKSEIELIEILNKLPNLKILETKTFPLLFSDMKHFKSSKNQIQNSNGKSKLDLFLEKIQSLEVLNLDLNLNPDLLLSLIPFKEKFSSVGRIQMNQRLSCEISFALHILIQNQLHVNWNISSISMSLSVQQVSKKVVRKFLESFSTTLNHLKITFFEPRYFHYKLNEEYSDNDDENNIHNSGSGSWYIPSNLKQLKILEILRGFDNSSYVNGINRNAGEDEEQMDNKYGIWPSLLIALQLPRLKKLVLGYLPQDLDSRLRQEQLKQFPTKEEDNGKKRVQKVKSLRNLRNESLEELELKINVFEALYPALTALTSSDLWPGLKSIKIDCFVDPPPFQFDSPASEPRSTSFLSNWMRIERLDVEFLFNQKNIHLFEYWLTGIHRNRNCSSSSNAEDGFGTPGFYLKDLKNLTHLKLRGPIYGLHRLNQPFTDFLIHNSLRFMKNLQSIYFRNATIGEDALAVLKDSLGPQVAVVLEYDRYFKHG